MSGRDAKMPDDDIPERNPSALPKLIEAAERLKRAENQLRQSGLFTLPLYSLVTDAILMADSQSTIIWVNRAAVHLFEYTSGDEMLGMPIQTLMPPDLAERHVQAMQHADEHGYLSHPGRLIITEAVTKTGHRIPISVYVTMWKQSHAHFFGAIIHRRIVPDVATTA